MHRKGDKGTPVPIFLGGHSLGGALANLCFAHFTLWDKAIIPIHGMVVVFSFFCLYHVVIIYLFIYFYSYSYSYRYCYYIIIIYYYLLLLFIFIIIIIYLF